MKKKLVSLLMSATMAAGLMSGMTVFAEEAPEELDVIYLSCSTASEFWQYIGVGISNAVIDMEEEYGITINLQTTGPSEEAQTEQYVTAFESAITEGPDAIVTATQVPDATIPKAQEAVAQGIVLNFVNCGLVQEDVTDNADCYNEFYYCSNETIGALAAEQMLAVLEAKGLEPKGTVAMNYSMVNANGEQRMRGFSDYMAENAPDIVCTETYYNNNDLETAQSNVENQISTFGDDLIGIYSGNNVTSNGAVLAVQTAGINDKIAVVGVDSDATQIEALQNGVLDVLIVQDAYTQGYKAMENAIRTIMDGENPEAEQQVNCEPQAVTPDMMEDQATQELLDPTLLAK